jgi:predicted dehydrogenase
MDVHIREREIEVKTNHPHRRLPSLLLDREKMEQAIINVLINWTFGNGFAQCPKRIRAFCGFGKYHESSRRDVTAYVEYENGATGVFIASTGEAPGTNRFEIAGDLGAIGAISLAHREERFVRRTFTGVDDRRSRGIGRPLKYFLRPRTAARASQRVMAAGCTHEHSAGRGEHRGSLTGRGGRRHGQRRVSVPAA